MELSGILLFIIGFILGGAAVWFLRQKEVESIKESQEQVKNAFGDLSNEVLIENQKNFLELAEDKFSSLLGKSDEQCLLVGFLLPSSSFRRQDNSLSQYGGQI